jgi:hypothetical protein
LVGPRGPTSETIDTVSHEMVVDNDDNGRVTFTPVVPATLFTKIYPELAGVFTLFTYK